MPIDLDEVLDDILDREPRYKREAYVFILEALEYTVTKIKERRHISADELLDGIRRYAQEKFGPMTRTVIDHWGIRSTRDFGTLVFHLLDKNVLAKSDTDSIDDFDNVFDIDSAFGKNL